MNKGQNHMIMSIHAKKNIWQYLTSIHDKQSQKLEMERISST